MAKVHAPACRFRACASGDAGSKIPGALSGSPLRAAIGPGVAAGGVAPCSVASGCVTLGSVGSCSVGSRSVALGSCAGFAGDGSRSVRTGCPRNVVPAAAGSGFSTRLGLDRQGLTMPVGVVPISVMPADFVPVRVVALGIAPLGCDYIRINLIGLAELLLRRGPHAFGFRLLFVGVPAQPLCLDLGLLGIGLGTGSLGLAFPGSQLVSLGFFAHLSCPVPVRLHLPPPAEEQHRGDDSHHHHNADDDPHKLS